MDEVVSAREHEWVRFDGFTYDVCGICGVVRRADDRNKPCRGTVRVVPRLTEVQKHYIDGCQEMEVRRALGAATETDEDRFANEGEYLWWKKMTEEDRDEVERRFENDR